MSVMSKLWSDSSFLSAIAIVPAAGARPVGTGVTGSGAVGLQGGHAGLVKYDRSPLASPAPLSAGPAAVGGQKKTSERAGIRNDEPQTPVLQSSTLSAGPATPATPAAELLQRAHDLGFTDGHTGGSAHRGEITHWPEVVQRPTELGELLKAYQSGLGQGNTEREKDAIARKLGIMPGLLDASKQQLLEMAHDAYEKGVVDGQANNKPKPPPMEPLQPGGSEVSDAYDRGYKDGQWEVPEAHTTGFQDGAAGVASHRGEIEQKDAPHVTDSYDRGFGEGEAERKRAYNDGLADAKKPHGGRLYRPTPHRQQYEYWHQGEISIPFALRNAYDHGFNDGGGNEPSSTIDILKDLVGLE